MQQFSGKAISPGYAEGTAFVYRRLDHRDIPRYEIVDSDVSMEHRRLHDAITRSFQELKQLEAQVVARLGEAHSAIFAAHLGLLQDQQFVARIRERIQRDLINVEHALDIEVTDLCKVLAAVENEYLRERAQDIRDVSARVLRQLVAEDGGRYEELPPRSIIVAHELLPSETLDLDREHVAGIVTEVGGENSHAAILARALGIPAITGVADATSQIPHGAQLLIDGERGLLSVTPNDAAKATFTTLKSNYDDDTSAAVAAENLDCITRDGTRISLFANINRPFESRAIAEHHLDGVGLFRTEFMFLESTEPPGYARQVDAYREMITPLGDKPVVIRTLDLGGDKLPAFLAPERRANPLLGLRGLQFSLAERKLLETQLRAIITASQGHDNVRVLLPMVLGEGDLDEAITLVRNLSTQLGVTSPPRVGAMVETPSALFALDRIMHLADFVCIGTNDLTQYMLAADRNASEVGDAYSVLHPSVLRAIVKVIEAGRSAGREVSICGEAASYPKTAGLLVGLGVRQLSMSPLRAARVRYLLRKAELSQLEELAERALNSSSVEAVRQLLQHSPLTRTHCDSVSNAV